MSDELDLDPEDAGQQKDEHPIDKRIKNALSDRDLAKKEAEENAKLAEEAITKRAEAEKERDFYKGFATVASKYQNAAEYQDEIRKKVMLGYDVEDATVSILAKEGKFTPPVAPPPPRDNPAGGSAANQIKSGEQKAVGQMTLQEKLTALKEAEARGDISLN